MFPDDSLSNPQHETTGTFFPAGTPTIARRIPLASAMGHARDYESIRLSWIAQGISTGWRGLLRRAKHHGGKGPEGRRCVKGHADHASHVAP